MFKILNSIICFLTKNLKSIWKFINSTKVLISLVEMVYLDRMNIKWHPKVNGVLNLHKIEPFLLEIFLYCHVFPLSFQKMDEKDQTAVDNFLLSLDGTENKSKTFYVLGKYSFLGGGAVNDSSESNRQDCRLFNHFFLLISDT